MRAYAVVEEFDDDTPVEFDSDAYVKVTCPTDSGDVSTNSAVTGDSSTSVNFKGEKISFAWVGWYEKCTLELWDQDSLSGDDKYGSITFSVQNAQYTRDLKAKGCYNGEDFNWQCDGNALVLENEGVGRGKVELTTTFASPDTLQMGIVTINVMEATVYPLGDNYDDDEGDHHNDDPGDAVDPYIKYGLTREWNRDGQYRRTPTREDTLYPKWSTSGGGQLFPVGNSFHAIEGEMVFLQLWDEDTLGDQDMGWATFPVPPADGTRKTMSIPVQGPDGGGRVSVEISLVSCQFSAPRCN